jgi:hypothetical protein
MASKRQVEANRRNARRSRGPRSAHGKRRASKNALRHGLARQDSSAAVLAKREKLARRIAGNCQATIVLEFARAAAEADLKLADVRRVKIALIQRVCALGALAPPKHFRSAMQEVRWCQATYLWTEGLRPTKPPNPIPIDPLASMPVGEPDRSAEAVRRVLTELVKLDRHENRAASRRERAIREMLKAKTLNLQN